MTSSTQSSPPGNDDGSADMKARLRYLEDRVRMFEDQWRRALAESDNMRKRLAAEAERIRDTERAAAAASWLPIIDDLDRALEHAEDDPAALADGVRAIRDEALRVLAELGFPRRDDEGAVFDPAQHDAIATRPADGVPAGTVLEVVRPGYGIDDRQLRPALVVVAEGS